MNLRKLWAAAVIALLPVTLIAQDSGTRLDGSARRLDASPVSASSGGLTNGRVALSNGSTQVTDDAGLTYNKTTDVLTSGAVTAKNLTATGLATPGSITVTPTLTQVGSITTVAAGWRANGLLTVVAGSALLDGETFVLSDGTHVPQSFEFDVANDGVVGGHVEIDIAGTETPAQVGALCAAAIDATTSATFTYDAIDNLDGTVALWNTTWAAAGNTAQSETVADAGFVVTNMTGGVDAGIVDGDYLTIRYSLAGTVPLEFDTGDGTTGGRIPVLFTGTETADDIRDLLITALNAAAPTQLTASSGGAATVALVLDTPGAVGDTNTQNVTDAGFEVTGFVNPTAATTYTYKLVARLSDGSTTEAGAASTTAAGHATLSAANYNALSWSAVSGAASYDVYRTVGGATQGKIASATTALSLNDTGLAGGGETAPTVDGTGRVTADSVALPAAGALNFGTDTGLARSSAGALNVTNGSTGLGFLREAGYLIAAAATEPASAGEYKLANGYYSADTRMSSGWSILWTPDAARTDGTPDIGLARASAGVLKVTDGSTGAGRILVGDGSAGAPSVAFASDPDSGLRLMADGTIAWPVAGIDRALLNGAQYQLRNDMWLGWSGNVSGDPSDTVLSRAAAAALQLGKPPNATPVANTLIVGESGAGTDIPGANGVIQSGAGTGSGAGSQLLFKTPTAGGSGAGAQTQTTRMTIGPSTIDIGVGNIVRVDQINTAVDITGVLRASANDARELGDIGNAILWKALGVSRATLGSKTKTFTNNTKTGFVTIAVPSSTVATGTIIYEIFVKDATNTQAISGELKFSAAANSSGTVTAATTADAYTPLNPCTSGTLTNAITQTTGTNTLTIEFQPNSSLTSTVREIHYRVNSPGTQTITPL